MLLGYSPAQVARPYIALIAGVNTVVFVLAACATAIAARCWSSALVAIGVTPASIAPSLAIGAAIMAIVSAINIISVRRRVRKDF